MKVETKIRTEQHDSNGENYTSVWLDHYVDGDKSVVSPTLILRVPTNSIAGLDPEKDSFVEMAKAAHENFRFRARK